MRCNRLSVFAGGCDLAAAEAVLPDDDLDAADVIDVLGQLVDKSLVVVDDADGGVRYRLLETIRQYARERLDASGDPVAVRRRHADHYVALAEAAGPHLRGREHLEWSSVIERDIDNFRAALDWAVETPSPEHALRLVAAVGGGGQDRRTRDGLGRDRDRDPGRRRSPALSRGRRLGRVGRHHGSRFRAGRRPPRRRRTSPSGARYTACVRGAGSGAPRVLS